MDKEFEKKYSVYIEEGPDIGGEYMYCKIEDAPKASHDRHFTMTYFFKKVGTDRNPMMVIEKVEGKEFRHRHEIILDFEENCALSFSVEFDGLLHTSNRNINREEEFEEEFDEEFEDEFQEFNDEFENLAELGDSTDEESDEQ